MELETAIVGLEDLLVDDPHFDPELRRKAVKLGIEALKRVDWLRSTHQCLGDPLLPGEEKE